MPAAALVGGPGHGGGQGQGEKGEGTTGDRIPPNLGGGGPWRCHHGGGRWRPMAVLVAALRARERDQRRRASLREWRGSYLGPWPGWGGGEVLRPRERAAAGGGGPGGGAARRGEGLAAAEGFAVVGSMIGEIGRAHV